MGVNPEIKEVLHAQFPMFESDLVEILSAIGSIKSFEEGDELMRTGQYFKSPMLIVDGLVKLYREGEDGGEFFVYYIEEGNACALSMVCASQQKTSEVTAKAMTDGTAILIPIDKMDALMTEFKSWYYFVLETYRSRFEEILTVVDAIAFKAMDERLEFYLKKQAQTVQSNTLSITHQQIAQDLSTSREVVSRLLKKMEQKGMVHLHRHQIDVQPLFD